MENRLSQLQNRLACKQSVKKSGAFFNAGFTVIEMVTVIAIFTILLGITMANFDLFKKTTDFNLSAQEVAFFIKSQQQNAMAGRFPEIDPYVKNYPPTSWRPSYGLYFSVANSDRVLQFYDSDNDFLMTAPSGNTSCANDPEYECMKEIIFDKMTLVSICDMDPSGCISRSSVSVVFKRPFPDARINADYTPFDVYDCVVNMICNATSVPTPVANTIELRFETPGVTGANIVSINPLGVLTVRRSSI